MGVGYNSYAPIAENEEQTGLLSGTHNNVVSNSYYTDTSMKPVTQGFWKLYIAHALCAWTGRMWEFAVSLLLIAILPNSLLLPASYSLAESASIVLLGSFTGGLVRRTNQLTVVRASLLINNISVILAGSLLAVALKRSEQRREMEEKQNIDWWLNGVYILGGLIGLSSQATDLAVERLWVSTIAKHGEELSILNTVLRRIDLICKICAPVAVGFIMFYGTPFVGAIFIGAFHVISFFPTYLLLHQVYIAYPVLHTLHEQNNDNTSTDETPLIPTLAPSSSGPKQIFQKFYQGWHIYFQQKIVTAGIALSFLYATVLAFNGVTSAYLKHEGISEALISIFRGAGALLGLAATHVYARAQVKLSITRVGLLSIWFFVFSLSFCVLSTFFPDQFILKLSLLVGGMVISRFGLWSFDLTVTQLLQEEVEQKHVAEVNGVQGSLNNFMEIIGCLMSVFINDPRRFYVLIYFSFSTILCAACIYSYYSWKTRGHLFHPEKVVEVFYFFSRAGLHTSPHDTYIHKRLVLLSLSYNYLICSVTLKGQVFSANLIPVLL